MDNEFYVLVCGDRNYLDIKQIRETLILFLSDKENICLVHGDCKGADKLSEIVAKEMKLKIQPCPADWKKIW
jgi:YspA, cpYpsA-related SLOG family